MVNIVKYLSSAVENGRRIIKVLRKGKADVQTAFEAMPFGTDAMPVKDLIAIYAETSIKGKKVIVGYINKNQLAEVGENRTYSTDENGDVKTFIWLKNDGQMQIGGDTDHMVRFSEMETAFNALKADFNDFVSTTYGPHTHITTATISASAVPGVLSPTTSQGTPSDADISGAKIDEIETI